MSQETPPPNPEPIAAESAPPPEEGAVETVLAGHDTVVLPPDAFANLRTIELEGEIAKLKDQLLRALAEAENIRRRGQRDKEDAANYAIASFARDMLAVADNLGRALASAPPEAREADGPIKNLLIGIDMTARELANVFERVGIKRIEAVQKRFDPNFHQAMFELDNPNVPAGTVLQVMQDGYVIRERLLRPAMVGVSKGGPKPEPVAEPQGGGPRADAYEKATDGGAASGSKLDTTL